jgi:hypothetical protein
MTHGRSTQDPENSSASTCHNSTGYTLVYATVRGYGQCNGINKQQKELGASQDVEGPEVPHIWDPIWGTYPEQV